MVQSSFLNSDYNLIIDSPLDPIIEVPKYDSGRLEPHPIRISGKLKPHPILIITYIKYYAVCWWSCYGPQVPRSPPAVGVPAHFGLAPDLAILAFSSARAIRAWDANKAYIKQMTPRLRGGYSHTLSI